DAGQASKRSPIGDPPHLGTSAVTARSAKAEIGESEYCSRFPHIYYREDIDTQIRLGDVYASVSLVWKNLRTRMRMSHRHPCPIFDRRNRAIVRLMLLADFSHGGDLLGWLGFSTGSRGGICARVFRSRPAPAVRGRRVRATWIAGWG